MKLLVIEHLESVRERMQGLLGSIPGVEFLAAQSIMQARQLCELEHPDAVVLDVQYPDGSGLDFLEYNERCCSAAQLIFFTNHVFYKRRCLTGGALYFFDKAMELDALVRVLTDMAKREND